MNASEKATLEARRRLVNLAHEYHAVTDMTKLTEVEGEMREILAELPALKQSEHLNKLIVEAGEIARLEVIHEHDWNHLARRQAGVELPQVRDELERLAYQALFANWAEAKARVAL